jgi:hypothetical protein
MDPRDRRLLKVIAISTAFLASVVAVALVLFFVVFALMKFGGNGGHVVTTP